MISNRRESDHCQQAGNRGKSPLWTRCGDMMESAPRPSPWAITGPWTYNARLLCSVIWQTGSKDRPEKARVEPASHDAAIGAFFSLHLELCFVKVPNYTYSIRESLHRAKSSLGPLFRQCCGNT
jgi:hypothetical protein